MIATAPVVAPSTPAIENREPPGYTAPVFFPFGKPEPTAPQLKLSGVSSFKKINRSGQISKTITFLAAKEESEADAAHHPELRLVHLKRTVCAFGLFLLDATIVSPKTIESTHTPPLRLSVLFS